MENKNLRAYIGDGVYVRFDGSGIWIAANHHENEVVYLEPEAIKSLNHFYNRMTQLKKDGKL